MLCIKLIGWGQGGKKWGDRLEQVSIGLFS